MSRLSGRYPGGPSRRDAEESATPVRGKVHLATVQELESRAAKSSQSKRNSARRKRLIVGTFSSLAIAGAVGAYLGVSSHRTDAEVAQEMEGATEAGKSELDQQVDRLIDEMWKSEALEKGPGTR